MSAARAAAVAASIEQVRELEHAVGTESEHGISPSALDAIKTVMIELGARADLFTLADFPIPSGREDATYRLSEDADGRYALYMNVGLKGQSSPVHDHGTWAVISGVLGDEHNQVYHKIDDTAGPGGWRLHADRSVMVSPGTAVAIKPEE
jgi:predicted metal-dependent enzyme (double-stranded beta helix superfamily)